MTSQNWEVPWWGTVVSTEPQWCHVGQLIFVRRRTMSITDDTITPAVVTKITSHKRGDFVLQALHASKGIIHVSLWEHYVWRLT